MSDVSRRSFLKAIGAGALGLAVRPGLAPGMEKRLFPAAFSSDVVQCYHDLATQGNAVNEPVVQMMMDESIMTLTGIRDIGEAWKSLFPGITESSVIGIKVVCTNRYLPSHPEVVRCIANGLAQMDFGGTLFKRNNVIVWDRVDSEMINCGFTIYDGTDPDTMRCFGTNHSGVGYDYGTPLTVNGVTSYPSNIISQMVDYIINVPALKSHGTSKVTLNLKTHYGSVNNASSLQHSNQCNPAIPHLNQQVRDVLTPNDIQKVFIIDGLFGLYSGGPTGAPNFNPKVLITSKDIVACDYQGQNVINRERESQGLSRYNATHITTAAQSPYNLGTTEVNLIELNNVGIEEPGARRPVEGLLQVAPQPVRGRAAVEFALGRDSEVRLDLVDAAGRTQAAIHHGRMARGRHTVAWQTGGRVAAGTYFVRMSSRAGTKVRQVTVVN
ncbi:DUF362 domain-containing protein [candidate division WOR-3 bacterium]|nr:DUF362 domain-containing protein [candidate division WOR-3 bacterium]